MGDEGGEAIYIITCNFQPAILITFPVGFYLSVFNNKMLSANSSRGDAVYAYKLQGAMVIQTQPFHPVLISWYYVNW